MLTLRPTLSAPGASSARAAGAPRYAPLFVALVVQCVVGCGGASTAPVDAPPKPPELATTKATVSSSPTDGPSEADGSGSPTKNESDSASLGPSRSITDNKAADAVEGEAAPAPSNSPIASGAPGGGGGRGKGGVERAVAGTTTTPLSGRMTQKDIGDILSANGALFNDCYTIGANGGQSFSGVVTVRATLGPTGAVNEAVVTKSTAQNAKVDACVAAAFKKIKFPKPEGGGTSVITFPMQFNGVEQAP